MDRIEYRPGSGFWCSRCNGSAVDLPEGGLARCNTCGFETNLTLPTRGDDFRAVAHSVLLLITVPAAIEGVVSIVFAVLVNSVGSIPHNLGLMWLTTGILAVLGAGMYAYRGGWVSNPNSIVNRNSDLIGWLLVSGAGLFGLGALLTYIIR